MTDRGFPNCSLIFGDAKKVCEGLVNCRKWN
jgi:hypothetical protein